MKVDHIALYVSELEQAKNFFISYFGAISNDGYYNKNTGFRSYFLSFREGCRIEIMHKENVIRNTDELMLGYHHIAFNLGSTEAVDVLTNQLQEDGYERLSGPRITGDGYYESCIKVMDSIIVELTV